MKNVKFEAYNWCAQQYFMATLEKPYQIYAEHGKLYPAQDYEYCLIPTDEPIPEEFKILIGQKLSNFVEFDEWNCKKVCFIYNDTEIEVEVYDNNII